ncbi:tagatose-bisphosphate aldolase [Virgibacillus halodenitrificans]|uniref:tagatose-bisphosphate aldolase n=1 Tax=Virgibacillus halodenitrificans TaxID=1482 RepID=UPI001369AFBC|nr:tagatose-bisphosphate aldolase [Virgibacillus halodenitrificans]MYL46762.1 tagatose-bisphosphate aldolase [Virgibacillus halodenitrificans]
MKSEAKIARLKKLTNENGYFSALAIDQRGALKRMMGDDTTKEQIESFKSLVSGNLTKYASAILLDPEYGWPAVNEKDANCGLLVAYEKTGYDATEPGRFPSLLPEWSVKRLVEKGADGIKVLIYHDIDDPSDINEKKDVFVERIGSECKAEEVPFFLEIITYDENISDAKGLEYAKVKPRKVIESMRHFSQARFGVDVLKMEVPVNMNFVEGYAEGEVIHTQAEAANYFKQQSEVSDIPYIFLSAGVSAELFQETLKFARESSASFHGVLCGRATWSGAAHRYKEEGTNAAEQWLQKDGKNNITELNAVLDHTASSCGY